MSDSTPPSPTPDPTDREAAAAVPSWLKGIGLVAGVVLGGGGAGMLGGGQAAAQERAVLTAKVERLEDDQREMRAELARKIDRLTDLILERGNQ